MERGRFMKPFVGLWIDHRRAVVAVVSDQGEETKVIESNVERQSGRLAGARSTTPYESQKVPADDSRERGFTGHLHGYYDEVIAAIGDAALEAPLKIGAIGVLWRRLPDHRLKLVHDHLNPGAVDIPADLRRADDRPDPCCQVADDLYAATCGASHGSEEGAD